MEKDRRSLKILYPKREMYFLRVQQLYDLSKQLVDDTRKDDHEKLRAQFALKFKCIDQTEIEYLSITDRINELELTLDDDFVINYTQVEAFNELLLHVKHAYETWVDKGPIPRANDAHFANVVSRLPHLQIPVFAGDFREWGTFFELFKQTIHLNPTLTSTEKMQYLIGHLKGKALSLCSGIAATGDNYDLLWQTLIKKYEDKRAVAQFYFDKIIKFKASSVESSSYLTEFSEHFVSSYDALKNLKLPDLADFLMMGIALGKLDSETTRGFENKMTFIENNFPTFKELSEFVCEQCKILERTKKPSHQHLKRDSLSNLKNNNFNNKVFLNTVSKVADGCTLCKKEPAHYLYRCSDFTNWNPSERFKFVKKEGRCYNCLSSMHTLKACRSQSTCSVCRKRHHTLLHFDVESNSSDSSHMCKSVNNCLEEENVVLHSTHAKPLALNQTVLLSTVVVKTIDSYGNIECLRLLLDTGSQSNFLSAKASKRLRLHVHKSLSSVKGIASTSYPVQGYSNFNFFAHFDENIKFSVDILVVDHMTDALPSTVVNIRTIDSLLTGLVLADDHFNQPSEIDGILGATIFAQVVGPHKVTNGNLCALETSLGYIVMGSMPTEISSVSTHSLFLMEEPTLESMFKKFFEVEDLVCEPCKSPEDTICETMFNSSFKRDKTGKYFVSLPFKENPTVLGDSYEGAKRRLLSLERKLTLFPELRQGYNCIIKQHLDLDYISEVTGELNKTTSFFLPHHPVRKTSSSSTPLRIVYDASAKTSSSKSLNDILYPGPKLQSDLYSILLNFRLFCYAATADVRQMYLRIGLNTEHRQFQRILWRFNDTDPIKVFELNTVTFGITSSPYLALRTIQQLATDERSNFPNACNVVPQDMYVDDLATSFSNIEEGVLLYNELISLFKSGGFDLIKWASNCTGFLNSIPTEMRFNETVPFDSDSFMKVLGLQWQPAQDDFVFKVEPLVLKTCTKRSILSTVARIFDPLGLIAPVTIYAKLLLKELWKSKLGWDEPAPKHIAQSWEIFLKEIKCLSSYRIPRFLNCYKESSNIILGFCDASEKAYGAVIYLRTFSHSAGVQTVLVTAKTKVSPLKGVITIPRLELCGAYLLSKMLKVVIENFQVKISFDSVYAFSDSTIALSWIHSSPHVWKTFVANRVSKIHENTSVSSWYHIAGVENPADCLSRSLRPVEMMSHPLWLKGPSWVNNFVEEWPIVPFKSDVSTNECSDEVKSVTLFVKEDSNSSIVDLIQRCSTWTKLRRTLVYVLRFVKYLPNTHASITAEELIKSELVLLKIIQEKHFKSEIEILKNKKAPSKLFRKLSVFLHTDGLLRVGGRLSNANNLSFGYRHPILLPKVDPIVILIIDHYHVKYLHTGAHLLSSILRHNYWILSARSIIRQRVKLCNYCFKFNPKYIFPPMADLPAARVNVSKAFESVGCDYAGPFHISWKRTRGNRTQKSWICLFICLATKAIHLELASELSTACFMAAFKRFLSRRGPCRFIYTDQGTNFIGAKAQLEELYSLLSSTEYGGAFANEVAELQITWKMNPPSAPHFGGLWEANIKSVKTHLVKAIGHQILTYEEFLTYLVQVEALLNSRPLTLLSNDPSDLSALTPANFLTATPLKFLPSRNVSQENPISLTRPYLMDSLVQSFWKRWKSEYLHTLQSKQKWNTPTCPLSIGTIVLINNDSSPPLQWPMGVVEDVFPGKDGVIRVASIRTAKGIYTRPVVKLCPLPSQ